MNKSYTFRIYPTEEQQIIINKTFGCVRFTWNTLLDEKIEYYKATGKTLTNTPAHLKDKHEFLKEVDSMALCNVQQHLQAAFNRFFSRKEAGFPKFKSKNGSRDSYTTNVISGKRNIRITDDEKHIKLPKVGDVPIVLHRHIPKKHIIKGATVYREKSGRYFVSILTEFPDPIDRVTLDCSNVIGLDYSSPSFYVDSCGNTANMPHFFRRSEEKLKKASRKLSKMNRGSSNYRKQKAKVAKINEHIRAQRKDYLDKLSHKLAKEYSVVAVEGINLHAITMSLHLGKSTMDNGFGKFKDMLEYKLHNEGKRLLEIGRFDPTTKKCHICDAMIPGVTLKDRLLKCPSCGNSFDRDINAAKNVIKTAIQHILDDNDYHPIFMNWYYHYTDENWKNHPA